MKKTISLICSMLGFCATLFGLYLGISSIGASGLGELGVIFIAPSLIAFVFVLVDFLISIDKIKKGLVFSWVSSCIKIGLLLRILMGSVGELIEEIRMGDSNLYFIIVLFVFLFITAIPSVLNIYKLQKK